MSKGFVWIAQNNSTTDYMSLSVALANNIKSVCKINNVCIITDNKTKVPKGVFDHVKILDEDIAVEDENKFSNEYKVFKLSPFTHTIKLEADLVLPKNIDWWWNFLCQHDQVFSYHCRDYQDNVITDSPYRRLNHQNSLPDVYNGLHYFRYSRRAAEFYDICECIIKNWNYVRENILKNCHEKRPTTDTVYALANKIQDPLQQHSVRYEWFNFIHGKSNIQQSLPKNTELYNYMSPYIVNDAVYLGGNRINRIWHYCEPKNILEELNVRIS